MMRPVIVFASFGVRAQDAREKSLTPILRALTAAFPNFAVVEAYTSALIRRRLQQEGIIVPSLTECLEELCRQGAREIYVQPAHLTPGEEYENKICKEAEPFYARVPLLKVGEPMFFRCDGTKEDDIARGLAAVYGDFALKEEEDLVLLGHGSPHQHNPFYTLLQQRADEETLPVHIGVLEESDTPNFSMVLERLQTRGKKRVLLAPLLLSGGTHVTEDLAGDAPHSWKSRLQSAGFDVRLDLRALGEKAAFRRLYVEKVQRLIKG